MTRSTICMVLGASLLALLWLAWPAAAQDTTDCNDGYDNDGDGLVDFPDDPGCRNRQSPYEDPQCNDKDVYGFALDNDDGDGVANILDPQCYYQGEFLPWWDDESRKRPEPAPLTGGCTTPPDPLPEDWVGCGDDEIAGCGLIEIQEAPTMALPFLWLWFRRRGKSRKA